MIVFDVSKTHKQISQINQPVLSLYQCFEIKNVDFVEISVKIANPMLNSITTKTTAAYVTLG